MRTTETWGLPLLCLASLAISPVPTVCRVQTCGLGGMKPNTVILGWPNSWRKREDDSTKVFVDTIRNAGAGKMALLVPKGIQRFPDTGDTVKVS